MFAFKNSLIAEKVTENHSKELTGIPKSKRGKIKPACPEQVVIIPDTGIPGLREDFVIVPIRIHQVLVLVGSCSLTTGVGAACSRTREV